MNVSIPRRVDGRFPRRRQRRSRRGDLLVSQSPAGSPADFHGTDQRTGARKRSACLNPPQGRRPIPTWCSSAQEPSHLLVSIPRRVAGRLPQAASPPFGWVGRCLNPPKGRRPISTERQMSRFSYEELMSLNPPKCRRPISTQQDSSLHRHSDRVSQSPAGSPADFHRGKRSSR